MIYALLDYRKFSPHTNHKRNRWLPPSRKYEEDVCMKKLIAISVVFALVAGVAFAVDLGGEVIGTVDVIKKSEGSDVSAGAGLNRVRLQGGAEVADGKFGGWLRLDAFDTTFARGDLTGHPWETDTQRALRVSGIAWWKPIDQLKLGVGGNPDGTWGKEGNSGWMFTQGVTDTGVVSDGDNVWSKSFKTRNAFFGGWDNEMLFIEITPVDIVGINIAIPFFDGGPDIGDIFMGTIAQVDLNMSFGNIALTYKGNSSIKASQIFGYFGLTAIDNLRIDFGIGADFQDTSPINLGIAVKYGRDTWGIKFRSVFGIPTRSAQDFGMLFDVLPYFNINESFRVFISAGVNIANIDDVSANADWHVNPYIEIGEEWGPKFFAGIKVWASAFTGTSNGVSFALPIALAVSF